MKPIITDKAPKALGPYSQAIHDGHYLFISGQLPIDPERDQLVQGSIEEKTRRVILNIEAILEAAGMNFSHVVRVEVFMKDLNDFQGMNSEYSKWFISHPARQTVQVMKLPRDADIEISCIARM